MKFNPEPCRNALALATLALLATAPQASELADAIGRDYDQNLDGLFQWFHANPELSLQEHETSERLAAELENAGFKVTRNIAGTGLVGVMKNGDGPTLMIRADMDALPVLEKSGLPYASTKRQVNLEGIEEPVMHACGHDMHMTTLVGVAHQMAARQDQWRGTLMLLGQPAEEGGDGALKMVQDGVYDKVGRPDYALALHVNSVTPAGKIAFRGGLMYSSVDMIKVVIPGVGTHGAAPHKGKDPIVIGAQIVMALQTVVTREVSPLVPALITVGSFHAGSAPNIISDEAVLELTVRANDQDTHDMLVRSIERVIENVGRTAGMPEDKLPRMIVESGSAPTTVNDHGLAKRVRAAMEAGMGPDAFMPYEQTDMGGEDFPYLVRVEPPIPSVYFRVGGTPQADFDAEAAGGPAVSGHHSPLFRIAPRPSVTAGVEAMTLAALDLLARP
jgi:hippurate hydrolase